MFNNIINDYKNNPDLIINKINDSYTIIYFESLTSADKINEYITWPIIETNKFTAPHTLLINENEKDKYLLNGYVITIYKNKHIYASEAKKDLSRSISTPDSEPAVNGPKDSLTENIELNLGLIKRRIKHKDLKIVDKTVGKYTNTLIDIVYIDSLADKKIIKDISSIIDNIYEKEIMDSGNLSNILQKNYKNDFPIIILSERPDEISNALVDGKIIILVDNSPYALIMPSFFTDFINPITDKYLRPLQNNFIKFIRYICLVITLVEPAYYIATINYNQETIPTSLLTSFIDQRKGVPFPSVFEALIMLIIYELLRESDSRFPSKYGSTISILGALILGEAAVKAGIVSPIMIITIALSYIASLVFNDPDFNNELRVYRYLFLIFAALLGLYGILLVFIFMMIRLCSTNSFNKSYTMPLSPFNLNYFKKYVWRNNKWKDY